MMIRQSICSGLLLAAGLFLHGCASPESSETVSVTYPPTEVVKPIFQISQAPASCRGIANLFATMPANMTTKDFSERVAAEAKSYGADLMLIGQSRQSITESSLNFSYYGPEQEFPVSQWPGWRFGLNEWGEQGSWTAIGFDDWTRSDLHYDFPIVMQVVFLRCQQ